MYNVKIVANTTVWCIGNLVSEQILRILITMRKVFTFFFLLLFFILYLYEMMEFFLRNRKEVYFSLTEDYRPKDSLSWRQFIRLRHTKVKVFIQWVYSSNLCSRTFLCPDNSVHPLDWYECSRYWLFFKHLHGYIKKSLGAIQDFKFLWKIKFILSFWKLKILLCETVPLPLLQAVCKIQEDPPFYSLDNCWHPLKAKQDVRWYRWRNRTCFLL